MKSIDEAEAQARLDEILEEAQRQPIVIRRQSSRRTIVNENCPGANFDRQRDRLPLAITKPSSRREPRRRPRRCPHLQPTWKDRDRRRNLPSHSRRNEYGLENGWDEIEALNSSQSDERTGV
jgi:hypothetical protein